ncbi:MAG: DsbA family protein [Paracoccaceae bacterium]
MNRLLAPILAAFLLSSPATAFDVTTMTDEERAAFQSEVRAYLLQNPNVIMEAVAALEEANAAQQAQADQDLVRDNASAIFDDGYSWVGGNPEGDITLVEFLDYRCGYCRRAHGEVAELLESDGNIRLIVKELPILGEESLLAARFAIAAKQVAGDAEYKLLNDALMTYNAEINEKTLRRLSNTLALDSDAIMAAMDSDAVTQEITQTRALAQLLQINGTPTFVMEDQLLRGYLPLEQMQALVAETRSN